MKVEGQVLLAGSYGLDMIPKEDGSVTIIINKNSESFGSFFTTFLKMLCELKFNQ